MNGPTLLVLAIVTLIVAFAAYGTYRMVKDHTYCSDCPKRDECCNPINCKIRND
jgi:hypothetical protein